MQRHECRDTHGAPTRRCLHRAHELRSPHVAAFARLALARWSLRFALAPPAGAHGDGGGDAAAAGTGGATATHAAAGGRHGDVDEEDRDQEEEEEAAQAPRRCGLRARMARAHMHTQRGLRVVLGVRGMRL